MSGKFGVRIWLMLAASATAGTAPHKLEEEAVLDSQMYFSKEFAERFNHGDFGHCAGAFEEAGTLRVEFGPGAANLQAVLNGSSTITARGQKAIANFWKQLSEATGISATKVLTFDTNSASRFGVDDDTVIISGPISFGEAKGTVVSQSWARAGKEWKIKSQMMRIDSWKAPAVLANVEVHATKTEQEVAAIEGKSEVGAQKAGEDPVAGPASAAPTDGGAEATAAETEAPGVPRFLFAGAIFATCSAAAFWIRRSNRRREATIAGFEAMLG